LTALHGAAEPAEAPVAAAAGWPSSFGDARTIARHKLHHAPAVEY
jgi:hypothetical protein